MDVVKFYFKKMILRVFLPPSLEMKSDLNIFFNLDGWRHRLGMLLSCQ